MCHSALFQLQKINLCFCDHVMFPFQKLTYLFVSSIGCCNKVQLNENGLADTREHSLVPFLYKARPCRNLQCELQIQQQPNSSQSFKICYVNVCGICSYSLSFVIRTDVNQSAFVVDCAHVLLKQKMNCLGMIVCLKAFIIFLIMPIVLILTLFIFRMFNSLIPISA